MNIEGRMWFVYALSEPTSKIEIYQQGFEISANNFGFGFMLMTWRQQFLTSSKFSVHERPD